MLCVTLPEHCIGDTFTENDVIMFNDHYPPFRVPLTPNPFCQCVIQVLKVLEGPCVKTLKLFSYPVGQNDHIPTRSIKPTWDQKQRQS